MKIRGLLLALCALGTGCGDSSETDSMTERATDTVRETPTSIFQNLRFEEIGPNGAVFRFTTTIETSCEAEFGVDQGALDRRATDPDMDPNDPYSITHEVPLGGLPPETLVFARARAEDRTGVVYVSDVMSFTTAAEENTGGPTNIARLTSGGSIAEVSSNFGGTDNTGTWGANNAIDGNIGTEWSSFGDGDDAYIVLDLGQTREVSEIRFQSRQMTDGTSIIQSITITTDDDSVFGPFDTPSPDSMYTIPFDTALSTQTLRIDAVTSTGGNTGAKEIEVYASPL